MLANMAIDIFIDNAMLHFRKIRQGRQKQLALDKFCAKQKRKSTEIKRQIMEKHMEDNFWIKSVCLSSVGKKLNTVGAAKEN